MLSLKGKIFGRHILQIALRADKYVGPLAKAPSLRTRVSKLAYFWYPSNFGVGCNSGASEMNGTTTRLKSRVWGFRKGVACLGSSQVGPCSPADSLPGTLRIPQGVAGRRRDLGIRGC